MRAPVSDKYPPGGITPHIYRKEQAFKNACFGDLYDTLINDLVDHGTLKEYTNGTTYELDEKVTFYGTVIKSTIDNNTTNPCEGTNWETANKFNSTCFNDLWERHLWSYLALLTVSESLSFTTFQIGGRGATKSYNEKTGAQTVGKSELALLKQNLLLAAEEELKNMKQYMIDNKSTCDFSKAKFLTSCKESCDNFSAPRRRFYFRKKKKDVY